MLFLHQVCSVCTRILTETLIGGIVSYFRLPAFAHDSFVVASLWLTRPLSPHTPGHHTTLNTTQALLTPSYFPLSGYRAACIYGTRLQLLSSLRLHRYMGHDSKLLPSVRLHRQPHRRCLQNPAQCPHSPHGQNHYGPSCAQCSVIQAPSLVLQRLGPSPRSLAFCSCCGGIDVLTQPT